MIKRRAFFCNGNPDAFIKSGKYEIRVRDQILIKHGYITKAKVKWYGIGNYAHPYLWKEKKEDTEYKESWGDPRIVKTKKEEVKKQIVIPKIKKDRGRKV